MDHAMTALSILVVGSIQASHTNFSVALSGMYAWLLILSIASAFLYGWFFIFDRYRKNSILDLKPLGMSDYVKESKR